MGTTITEKEIYSVTDLRNHTTGYYSNSKEKENLQKESNLYKVFAKSLILKTKHLSALWRNITESIVSAKYHSQNVGYGTKLPDM